MNVPEKINLLWFCIGSSMKPIISQVYLDEMEMKPVGVVVYSEPYIKRLHATLRYASKILILTNRLIKALTEEINFYF